MKILESVSLGTAVSFLVTALTFILKFIQSAKAKRVAEQTIKIGNAVLPYIKQAEEFIHYSGTEKKEFVMTKANQFAIEQGIPFNFEIVSQKVEELVKLTKEVNRREKDRTVATAQVVTVPIVTGGQSAIPQVATMPSYVTTQNGFAATPQSTLPLTPND